MHLRNGIRETWSLALKNILPLVISSFFRGIGIENYLNYELA